MAWTQAFPSAAAVEDRAEQALRWPIGAVSPLWAMFGAAAGAGVAWWWMTRWAQAVNVEALAGFAAAQVRQAAESVADTELRVEEAVVVADVAAAEAAADEAPAPVVAHEAAPVAAGAANDAAEETLGEALEPMAEASKAIVADDLTRLTGIGPKLSAALAERGVTCFAQIAQWSADDLAEVDAALSLKGRAVREAWVAQAKRFAKAAKD
ncbi:MAG TPA: hypothetical protein VN694_06060 [Caulobacteraceae bacterium]|nr:hypothetical protein [Caulobacteraceae bacterium]